MLEPKPDGVIAVNPMGRYPTQAVGSINPTHRSNRRNAAAAMGHGPSSRSMEASDCNGSASRPPHRLPKRNIHTTRSSAATAAAVQGCGESTSAPDGVRIAPPPPGPPGVAVTTNAVKLG